MYEVGQAQSFRAWHAMPGMEGPEGALHTHDYKLEIVVQTPELDERGMVIDLEAVNDALEDLVSRLNDANLDDVVRVAEGEAVTVEMLARWVHDELCRSLEPRPLGELVVRAWESPTAFGGYKAPLVTSS